MKSSIVQRVIAAAIVITEFLILCDVAMASTDVAIVASNDVVIAATKNDSSHLSEYCWHNDETCNIIGNFTRTTINLSFPVNIECVQNDSEAATRSFDYRFQGIDVILLNGCGVSRLHGNSLLGIQFIPDPHSVRHLTLEMFNVIGSLDATTFDSFPNLCTLLLMNNRIEHLVATSFNGLTELTELILLENSIEQINATAFEALTQSLKSLTLHEKSLKLFELSALPNLLRMDLSMKELRWTALHAANDVATLKISDVERIVFNATSDEKKAFLNLTELHVNYCRLADMPIDYFPQMLYANFSHNQLKNVSMIAMQATQVVTFDISYNAFRVIDVWLLSHLRYLEYFVATHNYIAAINPKAFQRNFYLKSVDLRFNQLKSLSLDLAILNVATELTFRIDNNPWNCGWLNKVYGDDPHIFSMKFVYAKRMDRTNIRGLECVAYDDTHLYHSHLHEEDDQYHLTGERRRPQPMAPVEIMRRNPKHTAVLTIFILIIGVSTLLVGLYFYIRCRPLTSTLRPFYHTLPEPLSQQKEGTERHADIIRGRILPPNDYESPLSNRLARFEIDGVELGLGLKDILRPMQSVDVDQFDDIEFKDLYEEIPEKVCATNDESVTNKAADTMSTRSNDMHTHSDHGDGVREVSPVE